MRHILCGMIVTAGLMGCQAEGDLPPNPKFQESMHSLCGQTLTGNVVSDDPQDADWRDEILTAGPVKCGAGRMVIPLAVGDDKSRVWTIRLVGNRLTLSHAHTLKDGSPDPVTGYGGKTENPGSATRQDFPVDQFSKDLFLANGLDASVTNVWTLEMKPDDVFAYELNREGRHFRAEFPLK